MLCGEPGSKLSARHQTPTGFLASDGLPGSLTPSATCLGDGVTSPLGTMSCAETEKLANPPPRTTAHSRVMGKQKGGNKAGNQQHTSGANENPSGKVGKSQGGLQKGGGGSSLGVMAAAGISLLALLLFVWKGDDLWSFGSRDEEIEHVHLEDFAGFESLNSFKQSNAFGPFAPRNYFKIVRRDTDLATDAMPSSLGLTWGTVTTGVKGMKVATVRSACTQGELTKYGFDAHDGMGYFKQSFEDRESGIIDAHLSVEGLYSQSSEGREEFTAVFEVRNNHGSQPLRMWFYDQRGREILVSGTKRLASSVGSRELTIVPISGESGINASSIRCLDAAQLGVKEWDLGQQVTKAVASRKKLMKLADKDAEAAERTPFLATCLHDFAVKPGATVSFLLRTASHAPDTADDAALRTAALSRLSSARGATDFTALWNTGFLPERVRPELLMSALPNILGSIGSFRGRLRVEGPPSSSKAREQAGSRLREREDRLLCIVPSRSFFPRGFLWDEGFHVLALLQPAMLGRRAPQLRYWAVDIIGSWLRLQDRSTGWIPREIALGEEAVAQVPPQFLAQSPAVANPPALLLSVAALWQEAGPEREGLRALIRKEWLPPLKRWFAYLMKEQAAKGGDCFRWKGRTAGHCLASGLDDYPRGLMVNEDECHLDLHAWILLFARVLHRISGEESYAATLQRLRASMFETMTWEREGRAPLLADFISKQPYNATAKSPIVVPPWSSDGQCSESVDCDPYSTNPCCSPSGWCGNSEAHCKCPGCRQAVRLEKRRGYKSQKAVHSPHLGYVSLFPMLLGVLDPADARDRGFLGETVAVAEELLTAHGLASLAESDPLFRSGEDYWRGKLWGNIHALAAASLATYARELPSGNEALAAKMAALAEEVRTRWVTTVHRGLEEHKFFFENFEPEGGEPRGASPFTGWTAASVVLLSTGDGIEQATAWWARAVMLRSEGDDAETC